MSDRPPSPRPRVEQITGKGEEVGEKEMGGGGRVWGERRCQQRAALGRSPEMGPKQPTSGRPTLCSSSHSGGFGERGGEKGARLH